MYWNLAAVAELNGQIGPVWILEPTVTRVSMSVQDTFRRLSIAHDCMVSCGDGDAIIAWLAERYMYASSALVGGFSYGRACKANAQGKITRLPTASRTVSLRNSIWVNDVHTDMIHRLEKTI